MDSYQITYPLQLPDGLRRRVWHWPVHPHGLHDEAYVGTVTADSSDEELVAAVLSGNEFAFRILVERYQTHVVRTITGMLGNISEVDDCVQDVFIRLYGSIERYRGEASIKTYLTRIAINRSLDVLRRKKRSFFVPWKSTDVATVESDLPRPDDAAVSADERTRLRNAITSLSAEHRAVVVLRLIDGLSTADTADVLDIPYGTVLSRLKRASARLKIILDEDPGINTIHEATRTMDASDTTELEG